MNSYNSRKLVIIESPYAENKEMGFTVQVHEDYLRLCLRDSLMRDEAPFASHALYTLPGVLDDTLESEKEMGIFSGFQWLDRSDFTAAYIDLGMSSGMRAGIRRAEILGHDIRYRKFLTVAQRRSLGLSDKP